MSDQDKTLLRVGGAADDAQDNSANGACPHCGKRLTDDSNFCPACGKDLRGLRPESNTFSGAGNDALIDGRYRVLEKLGEGGMGSVYKVEHIRMGKVAAVKVMRADAVQDKALTARFLQEARVVARLSHPNTVQVFDSGELPGGGLYMAMEYVPGKDLAWHLRAHGPMKEEKAVAIAVQVLKSLQEAHEAGIVHRDIKPANIMLVRRRKGGDEQVKLLDFGIAKLQESEGRKSTTGDFIGTPAYMSPEQIRGESLDARSDIYSLGALLFELVTGRQLYVGNTPINIITQHVEGKLPTIVEVAPSVEVTSGFEAVLRKSLARQPADRYADADSFRAALEALHQSLKVPTSDYTPLKAVAENMLSREDFDRYERSLRWQRAAMPLAVFAVLVVAVLFGIRALRAPPPPGPATAEVEPNDDPLHATPIALNTDVTGSMGARAAGDGAADRDLFVVQVPEGPVRVTLSAVPDLNLTLELLQLEKNGTADKLRRKVWLDDAPVGGAERLDALMLSSGSLYLRVEEQPFCTEPSRPPRERSLVPYTLRVEPMTGGPFENEPNDTDLTAQPLPLTRGITAFTGLGDEWEKVMATRGTTPSSAADFYRIDAAANETVAIVVVPPERGSLQVVDVVSVDSAKGKSPRNKPPPNTVVSGLPQLVKLEAAADGSRKVRIVPVPGSPAGASYRLAAATSGANGLAGVLDVYRALDADNQTAAATALLQATRGSLPNSPDLAQLKEVSAR